MSGLHGHLLLKTATILLLFGTQWSLSLRVQFYNKENYEGFIEEKLVSEDKELECMKLGSWYNVVKSVKTDKCLILYESENCEKGKLTEYIHEWNFYFQPSFRVDGNTPSTGKNHYVYSYHVCSQKLGGGPQLDMDITKVTPNVDVLLNPETYQFRGVCGCTNIPSSFVGGYYVPILVDSYGNSVNFYYAENCQGESLHLAADETINVPYNGYLKDDVKSFQPAELNNCYRLSARIFKFEFRNGTHSIDDLATEKVPMAADVDVQNNATSTMSQTFKVTLSDTQTVQFSIGAAFTNMDSAGIEASLEVKSEVGVPGVSKGEITAKIASKYNWSKTNSSDTRNTTTVSHTESIEVSQTIGIPPCSTCVVSSYLKRVKDFRVDYTAYAKVSAPNDMAPMTTEELKKNLPEGMTYIRDVDEHTVEASTEGSMYVGFGLKGKLENNCDPKPIPNCFPDKAKSGFVSNYHQHFQFPLHENPVKKSRDGSHRLSILSFLQNTFFLLLKQLG